MSTRPIPVALTTAYLFACYIRAEKQAPRGDCADYMPDPEDSISAHTVASLASAIHRILPALQRSSEAQCNGEEYPGQRDFIQERIDKQQWTSQSLGLMTERIEKRAPQLTRRIAKLSEQLRPYGLYAYWQTDPRGTPLYLVPIGEDDYSRGFCVGG